jgi:hypothetical protein
MKLKFRVDLDPAKATPENRHNKQHKLSAAFSQSRTSKHTTFIIVSLPYDCAESLSNSFSVLLVFDSSWYVLAITYRLDFGPAAKQSRQAAAARARLHRSLERALILD